MTNQRELYLISMQEPISIIMTAVAEKASFELIRNPMQAQRQMLAFGNFNCFPMLKEILDDILTVEEFKATLSKSSPGKHLEQIGFDKSHADYVCSKTSQMAIAIIGSFVPDAVLTRTDKQWNVVEPYDLHLYTYKSENE